MKSEQLTEIVHESASLQPSTVSQVAAPDRRQDAVEEAPSRESLQAELAVLREQLALLYQAFDAVQTHFTITRNTDDDRIIEYCNAGVAKSRRVDKSALLGKSVSVLSPDVWGTPESQKAHQAIRAGEPVTFERTIRRKDGTSFVVGVTVVPVRWDEQGRATHSFSMGADITARRAAEQHEKELQEQLVVEMKQRERILLELRLAQKLESVGRLAAGIAHEINTPIQYVGDSLHFLRSVFDDLVCLLDSFSAALDEQAVSAEMTALKQHLLDAMKAVDLEFLLEEAPKAFGRTFEGVDRVAGIVRALKEFSHPDATEFSSADLNRALQSTLVVATNEYKYIAKVRVEFDPDLPLVICNIGELNQVFLNLIVNAAHAIHDAGKDVNQGEIRITSARIGDHVEISVTDNGCGIQKEHLDKIYDPFFTTKEVGRGTGQGLAITHSIVVDRHGGSVQVASDPNVGTKFVIRLPIAGRSKGTLI